jgi:OOP family OmpA-OmpF porin
MTKRFFKMVVFISMLLFLVSCAAQPVKEPEPAFQPVDLNPLLRSGEYLQRVQNFLVVLDTSGTMKAGDYPAARDFVDYMNMTIPTDLKLKAGMRAFGGLGSDGMLPVLLPWDHYDKARFNAAIPPFAKYGMSPLGETIAAAGGDLKETTGPIALIVVSDGMQTGMSSPKAAEAVKKAYGDRICIYSIHIGKDPEGKEIMDQVTKAGECGFPASLPGTWSIPVETLLSPKSMAEFVARVFLVKAPPKPQPVVVAPPPPPPPPPPPGSVVVGVGADVGVGIGVALGVGVAISVCVSVGVGVIVVI